MAGRCVAPFALVALCLFEVALQGAAEPLVPAMFVFGDSTVDVGNNNFLPDCNATCKANHPRYGVDYPYQSPTGRFSNGYNLADQIAQHLGFNESPPAFLSLPDERIIPQMKKSGINFASGGSGLQDQTGRGPCRQVFNMSAQVQNFSSIVRKMGNGTADLISNSLIFISTGSNDLFEYIDNNPPPNRNDTELLQNLTASYTSYLKELYEAGARKFSVVSPSLVGCCPSQRALMNNDVDKFGCFGSANNLSRQLYPMVASMLKDLNHELPGMNYSLGDSIRMLEPVLNRTEPGMNLTAACCGSGGAGGCNYAATLCQNRTNYLFWDAFHPTEAASGLAAGELFSDPGRFVHPINVQQLAALRK